jgi:hypothetical protein
VLALTTPVDIEKFFNARGIGWYLLRPETTTSWPAAFLDKSAFACGGYRVFHFETQKQVPLLSSVGATTTLKH